MISAESAAGLIASAIQGTVAIGPQWDTLSSEEVLGLAERWRRVIANNPDEASEQIIRSIANHPHLRAAWSELGSALHQNRALMIRAIIAGAQVADFREGLDELPASPSGHRGPFSFQFCMEHFLGSSLLLISRRSISK